MENIFFFLKLATKYLMSEKDRTVYLCTRGKSNPLQNFQPVLLVSFPKIALREMNNIVINHMKHVLL
jgi:hypothetical protein